MKLYYKIKGKGEPLIILHGLYGSSHNWNSVAKALILCKLKVIIVDLRNHGKSPKSTEHNYKCMAEDINELFETLNIKSAYLMGYSMGGKVAMTFSALYPNKIKKLIIVDVSPKAYNTNAFQIEQLQHNQIISTLLSLPIHELSERKEIDKLMAENIKSARLRMFLLKNLHRLKNEGFEWKINLYTLKENLNTIMGGLEHLSNKFKAFPFKTLFIKGGNSDYITSEHIEWIKNNFLDVEIKTIQGASHWLHAEKENEFLKIVEDFLK